MKYSINFEDYKDEKSERENVLCPFCGDNHVHILSSKICGEGENDCVYSCGWDVRGSVYQATFYCEMCWGKWILALCSHKGDIYPKLFRLENKYQNEEYTPDEQNKLI